MSRKIHHGSNGSYKTSGALADDLIRAVKTGRPIVSNVRGLNDKDKIINAYYKSHGFLKSVYWRLFPSKLPYIDFDLYYLDTEHHQDGEENIEKLRRWMEWIPQGAFIIFDEIDEIYPPKKFNQKLIDLYDYPPTETLTSKQASIKAGRWNTLSTAFSKHRHFNLDMVFTCTSIKNVHPMIREGADMGYRHFNLANAMTLASGRYREIGHHPENNGSSETYHLSNQIKKIPKYIFSLYESTSTGEVNDTVAGTSLWNNGKLKFMVLFLVVVVGFNVNNYRTGKFNFFGAKNESSNEGSGRTTISYRQKKKIKNNKSAILDNKKNNNADNKNSNVKNSNEDGSVFGNGVLVETLNEIPIPIETSIFLNTIRDGIYFTGSPLGVSNFRTVDGKVRFTGAELAKYGIKVVFLGFSFGFVHFEDDLIAFKSSPQYEPKGFDIYIDKGKKALNSVQK